ncbi:hypothetical protein COT30_05110 [Candidatus Micrarchaeota archaeon CG08_land_8_20_14_0_20_49_17]|nr:MAG: hypothetical protein AUJ13_04630 [Candidatus Micrarchaeota archaeon CG1_02_49_24]PIU09306.1 MAG: hypothetical protein COT30_05110 [Candidatus Micrarchaeota archaeon CG08_land_8_20_14_0_20_49_17]PIU81435.1 MAG: hypothetical protein COS70_04105 [Candidatus Micrarchaeota archaeon CG06_land_8_20_14_3_00_50_6]PIZ97695.1 MAG: hypothetical protein COX84_02935 [Candidatus Micrarchaeota archaeon CG_4_10_14_0_2_um_filter_49_7]
MYSPHYVCDSIRFLQQPQSNRGMGYQSIKNRQIGENRRFMMALTAQAGCQEETLLQEETIIIHLKQEHSCQAWQVLGGWETGWQVYCQLYSTGLCFMRDHWS